MSAPDTRLTWTPLEWDSEFFGFPVGRADLTGATAETLAALDHDARAAGIRCLYGSHNPVDPALSGSLQSAGWILVDAMSRFEIRPTDQFEPHPSRCTVRRGTVDDLPAMQEVIESLAPWSRFSVDDRFTKDDVIRIQALVVERAAQEGRLLVAEEDGSIHAFLTRRRNPLPTIETIASIAPGSGAAHAIIDDTRAWASGEPLSLAWAAARNIPCFRLFARLGFRVAEVRYQYHRWLT